MPSVADIAVSEIADMEDLAELSKSSIPEIMWLNTFRMIFLANRIVRKCGVSEIPTHHLT